VQITVAVVAAACAPAMASVSAPATQLRVSSELVLRLDDVKSGGFVTIDSALTIDDAASTFGVPDVTVEDFERQRFTNGYTRAFAWRSGSDPVTTLMASSTYLFADAAGAHEALSLFARGGDAAGAGRLSVGPRIGDESAAFQIDRSFETPTAETIAFTTTAIAFRHANALSLVTYRCLAEEDDVYYEIGLARKQFDRQKAVAPAGIPLPAKATALGSGGYGGMHTSATGLVLDVGDTPMGMRVRNEGPLTAAEFAAGDADLEGKFLKHGFQSAYGRVFARSSQFGKEPRVIRSETAILADTFGAHDAFTDFSKLATTVGSRILGSAGVGDESRVLTLDDFNRDTSFVEILVRHRNALSVIEIQFPIRMISRSLSLDLANKQLTYHLADLGMLKPF